jgi:hypothetical protein
MAVDTVAAALTLEAPAVAFYPPDHFAHLHRMAFWSRRQLSGPFRQAGVDRDAAAVRGG